MIKFSPLSRTPKYVEIFLTVINFETVQCPSCFWWSRLAALLWHWCSTPNVLPTCVVRLVFIHSDLTWLSPSDRCSRRSPKRCPITKSPLSLPYYQFYPKLHLFIGCCVPGCFTADLLPQKTTNMMVNENCDDGGQWVGGDGDQKLSWRLGTKGDLD